MQSFEHKVPHYSFMPSAFFNSFVILGFLHIVLPSSRWSAFVPFLYWHLNMIHTVFKNRLSPYHISILFPIHATSIFSSFGSLSRNLVHILWYPVVFLIYLLSYIMFASDIPLEYARWRDKQACYANPPPFFFVVKVNVLDGSSVSCVRFFFFWLKTSRCVEVQY